LSYCSRPCRSGQLDGSPVDLGSEGLRSRADLEAVVPVYAAAYRTLLRELESRDTDTEAMFAMFDELRTGGDKGRGRGRADAVVRASRGSWPESSRVP
jgi:hypothetical protein